MSKKKKVSKDERIDHLEQRLNKLNSDYFNYKKKTEITISFLVNSLLTVERSSQLNHIIDQALSQPKDFLKKVENVKGEENGN